MFMPSCEQSIYHKKTVNVYRLQDGRYCYQDDATNKWYWYFKRSGEYYLDDKSLDKGIWCTVWRGQQMITPNEEEIINFPHNFIIIKSIFVDDNNSPIGKVTK